MKGLAVTMALNIPWAISFTAQGMAGEVLPFMTIFGVVFGALIVWLSGLSLVESWTGEKHVTH